MIRHIGTKEHGCVKVKVFCISCTVIEFVSAVKMRLRMNAEMQTLRSIAEDYKTYRG